VEDLNYRYSDPDFVAGTNAVAQDPYVYSSTQVSNWRLAVANGSLQWKRWKDAVSSANVFNSASTPKPTDPRQGQLGDCYIMSSLSSVAEQPDYVKNAILTQYKNTAGIYAIRFYIRGKPWVVSLDDKLLFQADNSLYFGLLSADGTNIWGAIFEKAWAKVKGSYDSSASGFVENGLRALTGAPVESFKTADITNAAQADAAWTRM